MTEVIIAIITFRRQEQLRKLLCSIAEQRHAGFVLEVLVVDNDAKGSAADVCKELAATLPLALHYVNEPEPGIVAARNRCVSEFLASTATQLAFIDDDEWPKDAEWISSMLRCMENNAADIVAGDVISEAGPGTPLWATRILYDRSRRSDGDAMPVFYTGNVLIGRAVLERLAPAFDTRFALTGASDYHFALRCAQAGFRAVYADALVIEEFPADRATVKWFMRRGFRSGAGYTRSHLIEDPMPKVVFRCLALAPLRFARGLGLLAAGVVTFDRARLVKGLFRTAAATGTLAGLGGLSYEEYRELHDNSPSGDS